MSHGPDCGGEAVVGVQGKRQNGNKGQRDRIIVQPRQGNWGGNRGVVRKEISVRITVACGHDSD